MKIAVVGASGRTGQEVVREAQGRGHHVVAVVRRPDRLGDLRPAAVAVADAQDVDQLAEALSGADVVVSCVGPVKREPRDVQARATDAVVRAAGRTGVRRLVALSASGWVVDGDDPLSRYVAKPVLARALREENAAFAATEQVVAASALDWTIVRPPMLQDGRARGRYRSRRDGNVRWHYAIRRADLAVAVVDLLEDPTTAGATVSVSA
jgi:putative NADH-flavin reductase